MDATINSKNRIKEVDDVLKDKTKSDAAKNSIFNPYPELLVAYQSSAIHFSMYITEAYKLSNDAMDITLNLIGDRWLKGYLFVTGTDYLQTYVKREGGGRMHIEQDGDKLEIWISKKGETPHKLESPITSIMSDIDNLLDNDDEYTKLHKHIKRTDQDLYQWIRVNSFNVPADFIKLYSLTDDDSREFSITITLAMLKGYLIASRLKDGGLI